MKLNEHERARPNLAGLASPVQQAEMRLILAGRWPPLKPLPVFKYQTDEYRATIDFDKMHGEWVCRITSFPSNKIQELRGGLKEITMAFPHGQEEASTEGVAAEQQEQELERDAKRRLQAILEWRQNYENGALYTEHQGYLSESQQDEIHDSIRLSLTARQLQFNPRNVAFVFDALLHAGGRLATLVEIAQRNKAERKANAEAQAGGATLEAERQAPVEAIYPARDRRLQARTTPASRANVELGDSNNGVVLNISETGMAIAAAGVLVAGDCLARIRLQLPGSRQGIEISAQIVWLAEAKKEAGIRFVDLTADARNQISGWIASDESTHAKHATSAEEIKPQQTSLPIPVGSHAHAGDSEVGSGAEISTGDFPQSPEASFPRERAKNFAAEPIKTFIPERSEGLTSTPVESLVPATLENFPTEPMGSVFLKQDETSSPKLIASTASQASEVVPPEIPDARPRRLAEDLQEKVHRRTPVAGFARQVRTGKAEPSAKRIKDSPSRFYVLEISGVQAAAFVILFAVISLTVGLTVGRGSLGKRLRDAQKSTLLADVRSPALPNRPSETTSRASTPPAANSFKTPAVNPPATETEGSRSESPSAHSLNARPADLATRVRPKPAHSPKAVGAISGARRNSAPRRVTAATAAAPHASPPSTVLVSGPGDGSKPFRLVLPEKPIAASSSFAMTSQLSVLVAPEPGPAVTHKPARLQAGELVSFVWPRYPRLGDRYGSSETVKVRTTIGKLGQVLDVKLVSGSISLLPAAMSAIRLWRYKPTFVNKKPVQAQQDVTIEFRPQQYLSQVPTQHPSPD
jgi:TonB family protein